MEQSKLPGNLQSMVDRQVRFCADKQNHLSPHIVVRAVAESWAETVWKLHQNYDALRARADKMEQALKESKETINWMWQHMKEPDGQTLLQVDAFNLPANALHIIDLALEQPTIPQQGGMPSLNEPIIDDKDVHEYHKLTAEESAQRKEAIEWYRNPEGKEGSVTEGELIGFVEWAAEIAFFDNTYRLWEFYEEGKRVDGQFRFTTKEFFALYKKSEGREKEE